MVLSNVNLWSFDVLRNLSIIISKLKHSYSEFFNYLWLMNLVSFLSGWGVYFNQDAVFIFDHNKLPNYIYINGLNLNNDYIVH